MNEPEKTPKFEKLLNEMYTNYPGDDGDSDNEYSFKKDPKDIFSDRTKKFSDREQSIDMDDEDYLDNVEDEEEEGDYKDSAMSLEDVTGAIEGTLMGLDGDLGDTFAGEVELLANMLYDDGIEYMEVTSSGHESGYNYETNEEEEEEVEDKEVYYIEFTAYYEGGVEKKLLASFIIDNDSGDTDIELHGQ